MRIGNFSTSSHLIKRFVQLLGALFHRLHGAEVALLEADLSAVIFGGLLNPVDGLGGPVLGATQHDHSCPALFCMQGGYLGSGPEKRQTISIKSDMITNSIHLVELVGSVPAYPCVGT